MAWLTIISGGFRPQETCRALSCPKMSSRLVDTALHPNEARRGLERRRDAAAGADTAQELPVHIDGDAGAGEFIVDLHHGDFHGVHSLV